MTGSIRQYTTIFVSVSLIIIFQSCARQDTTIYSYICKCLNDKNIPEIFGYPAGYDNIIQYLQVSH